MWDLIPGVEDLIRRAEQLQIQLPRARRPQAQRVRAQIPAHLRKPLHQHQLQQPRRLHPPHPGKHQPQEQSHRPPVVSPATPLLILP